MNFDIVQKVLFGEKVVLTLLAKLVIVAIWKNLTTNVEKLKACLHRLPFPFNPLVQWYSVLIIFISHACFHTVHSAVAMARSHSQAIFNLEKYDMSKLEMVVFEASPIVAALAFIGVAVHLFKIIRKSYKVRTELGRPYPWLAEGRQSMVILIVAMPSIFICMSIRSCQRMMMIMIGEGPPQFLDDDNKEMFTDRMLYDENFELAAVCQLYVVYLFARLCMSFLHEEEATEEMKLAMSTVGFQGVYAWCFIGSLEQVLGFGIAYSHNFHVADDKMDKAKELKSKLGILASAMSILATLNMLLICNLHAINRGLSNANLKFNGTKILLLLAPNQLKVMLSLTQKDSKIQILDLTDERAKLLHASLMCIECLVVVLINFYAWEIKGKDDNWQGRCCYIPEQSRELGDLLEGNDKEGYKRLTST